MAVELGKAILDLAIDLVAYGASLNKAEAMTKGATGKIQAHGETAGRSFGGSFRGVLATVGDISRIGKEVTDVLQGLSEKALESTKVENDLAAALGNIGTAALNAKDANIEYANAASMRFAIDDETIIGIQAQIALMSKLSGETLNQATQAVIQWSAQSGKSMDAATTDVMKALGPDGAFLTGFRRYGVVIEDTGSKQDILNQILDKTTAGLEKQEKQSQSFQGGLDKITIAWDNVIEAIGRWITTSPEAIALIQKIPEYLQKLADALSGHDPEWNSFIHYLKLIVEGFGKFIENAQLAEERFYMLMGKIEYYLSGDWLVMKIETTWNRIKTAIGDAIDSITSKVALGWAAITGNTAKMADELVGHSIIPDMNRAIIASFDEMIAKTGGITADGFNQIIADARGVYESLGGLAAYFTQGDFGLTGLAPYGYIAQKAQEELRKRGGFGSGKGSGSPGATAPVSGGWSGGESARGNSPSRPVYVQIVNSFTGAEAAAMGLT